MLVSIHTWSAPVHTLPTPVVAGFWPCDPFLDLGARVLSVTFSPGVAEINATNLTALAHTRSPDSGPGV